MNGHQNITGKPLTFDIVCGKHDIQVELCEIDALSVKLTHFWTPLAGPQSVENL